MKKVLILGTSGMLGSTVTRYFTSRGFKITEVNQSGKPLESGNYARKFSVENGADSLVSVLSEMKYDFVLNLIGLIKQKIDSKDAASISKAYEVNSNLPLYLNRFTQDKGVPIIQIGTDCVYSGKQGNYSEKDPFDPVDIYGKSKLLGEQNSKLTMIFRCSVIGKELRTNKSLMSWVLTQKQNAVLNGFSNHLWNGVTSLDFARILAGIIDNDSFEPGIFHLIPRNVLSKFELLKEITVAFGRPDIEIIEFYDKFSVNRTLTTVNLSRNTQFWRGAGYNEIPSIREMISTYAEWSKLF